MTDRQRLLQNCVRVFPPSGRVAFPQQVEIGAVDGRGSRSPSPFRLPQGRAKGNQDGGAPRAPTKGPSPLVIPWTPFFFQNEAPSELSTIPLPLLKAGSKCPTLLDHSSALGVNHNRSIAEFRAGVSDPCAV
jgi:hypothetical protein